ncbi:type II secretion system protein GspM [Hoeflea sp. TYP-13]|uniref:type II secretion system protein GspM n=1 Tax=Hoeflea sp. TYP-13 TaxID=3230023 RepID=UPI0034C63302
MIWLLNSSKAVQRTLAIGILLLALSGIALTITGALTSVIRAQNSLDEKRQLLGHLQMITKQLPLVAEQTAASNEAASREFLSGESESLIRANLQQRFKQIASAQRVSVISVGNAPDFVRNEVTYAGLQANLSGSIENLHKTLLALESSKPILFVTKLTVRSTDGLSLKKPVAEPVLVAQLRLYGALRPTTPGEEATE